MKLSDIELTDDQVAGLMHWLDIQAKVKRNHDASIADDERQSRVDERRAENLSVIAELTARVHGLIRGMRSDLQLKAAWDTFCVHEGVFSPHDIDDYFDPHCIGWDDNFAIHYEGALDKIKAGQLSVISDSEATELYNMHINKAVAHD